MRTSRASRGRGEKARRRPRAHPVERPTRLGKNHAGQHHRERDGREREKHERSRDRKSRRAGWFADESRKRRRAFHRRNPSAPADDRRISLSRDGGLPARHHHRPGAAGAQSAPAIAEVHAHWRDHARGDGERAVAFAFRNDRAARLLQRGRDAQNHHAQRGVAWGGDRQCRRGGDRGADSRHAADGEQSAPLGARLRAGEGGWKNHRGTGRSCAHHA